ncbi:MAG: FAD-dependent oxidoreductase [Deltaproteobacteria bacterium]|nr:FAD-dependent oxidoreductase [Deltaproteobacteria bacterium]MBW2174010.1 FAD-dependent oxidoreductase [Deltaproteobacteria bacterium]
MQDNTTHIKHNDDPPCKAACPILTDAREYVQLIAERRFEEAFASIRKLNPLPSVCGRICTHPCEAACKRGQVEEPIAIATLKRFACDGSWKDQYKGTPPAKPTGHKVAVVGSGPAGLAAAHDLALLGHDVTIFEALPILGGMLRVGVPAYRLPKDVLDEEIRAILALGIEAKTGVRLGKDIKLTELFKQGYKAVFLAIGAHKDRKLGIPGEDELAGVVSAVSFLRRVNQGESPEVGEKVAVIGGGNTAVDSARCALRIGVEVVHMVYRRTGDEMPAAREEIEDAIEEGIQISYLTSPLEILGKDGKVTGLKCIKNELGEPDAGGRRSPKPVPGSEFTIDVDMVIAAIGQVPDSSFVAAELGVTDRRKRIIVDGAYTLVTTQPGVFAGGDAVTGPATVVEAISAGKRAAISIDLYLREKPFPSTERAEAEEPAKLSSSLIDKTRKFSRCGKQGIPVNQRLKGFDEVDAVLSEDLATKEALRCLHCYMGAQVDREKCVSCLTCVRVCPLGIPATSKMGEITIDPFACQACGMCALECPVRAIEINLHSRGELAKQVEESARSNQDGAILGFFDYHGNFGAGDLTSLRENHPSITPLFLFGLRRLDTSHLLTAFECGADGVLLATCQPDADPFPGETDRLKRRVNDARSVLDFLGLDGNRLQVVDMPERGLFDEGQITEVMKTITELGPSPLR